MAIVVRAFPVLPGKENQVKEFARAMREERADEVRDFYLKYGIKRETWHLQQQPGGMIVIVWTELGRVEHTAETYATSVHPFESWFKSRILELTGTDPSHDPLGPPTESLLDWRARNH